MNRYLEILFNDKGEPCGGLITNFLLEKTRVAFQAKGERNFHIFYQLLAGASPEMRQQFRLENAQAYNYLSQVFPYFFAQMNLFLDRAAVLLLMELMTQQNFKKF